MRKWLVVLLMMLVLLFIMVGLKTGMQPEEVIEKPSAETYTQPDS